ncbi:MAG: FAD-binding oxidoreductase [Bryobacterales bacterium]|nr:FAD-binding oxidoreductase [Bryobacterales bacterium]
MPDVVIIGAGVTGLSTAYHLAKRASGRITVIDKGPAGDGSSSRAAGICTGLLWTETGIRVRRRCLALYEELSRELSGYAFHRTGCLNLFSAADWPARAALLPLYDELGAPYEVHAPPRFGQLRFASDGVALYDPLGGYSEPSEYLPALTAAVRAAGVTILEHTRVEEVLTANGAVTGVRTAHSTIPAGAVVCATYGWTRLLLEPLGVTVPVKAFVHQRFEAVPRAPLPPFPAVNANPLGIYARPARDGRVLVGIETLDRPNFEIPHAEFNLSSLTITPGLRSIALDRLAVLLPAAGGAQPANESVGLLTFSLDGEPILGPVAQLPGLFLGLAFHSGGFAYNPGAGELLAQFVLDGRTAIDVSTWSPNRFDTDEAKQYLATPLLQSQTFRRRH